MGGVDGWPGRTEFPGWLQRKVIPLLRFVVHGERLEQVDDGEASEQVIAEDGSRPEDGLVAYHDMPEPIAAMVDRALEVAQPEKREQLRNTVFFDRKPTKRRAALGRNSSATRSPAKAGLLESSCNIRELR